MLWDRNKHRMNWTVANTDLVAIKICSGFFFLHSPKSGVAHFHLHSFCLFYSRYQIWFPSGVGCFCFWEAGAVPILCIIYFGTSVQVGRTKLHPKMGTVPGMPKTLDLLNHRGPKSRAGGPGPPQYNPAPTYPDGLSLPATLSLINTRSPFLFPFLGHSYMSQVIRRAERKVRGEKEKGKKGGLR